MSENAVSKSKFSATIHGAAIAAAAIALGMSMNSESQSDSGPIIGIQGTMLSAITNEFDAVTTQTMAATIIGTCLATILGQAISRLLVRLLPSCGKVINAIAAAAITEFIGWCAVACFSVITIVDKPSS